jgi:hypothetical protein
MLALALRWCGIAARLAFGQRQRDLDQPRAKLGAVELELGQRRGVVGFEPHKGEAFISTGLRIGGQAHIGHGAALRKVSFNLLLGDRVLEVANPHRIGLACRIAPYRKNALPRRHLGYSRRCNAVSCGSDWFVRVRPRM